MNNNFNNEDADEIRPPDTVITEQLVQSGFDAELMEVLRLSMQETVDQERKNQEFEDKIMNDYLKEKMNRREKFEELITQLNKVSKYDKSIKEVYEIIEPIVETYCDQIIEFYNVDEETYTNIFKTLSTIRLNKQNIENLKTIICCI
jgi:hypothetical protein